MKGSFRSFGLMAACALSWTCSVYDAGLLSGQNMTTAGAAVVTGGETDALSMGGAGATKGDALGGAPSGNAGVGALDAGVGPNDGGVPPIDGTAGAGGDGASEARPACQAAPVPLKGAWKASASHSSVGTGEFDNPPSNVMDLSSMRWATGKVQAGDEWLQVDFGAPAAIRELSFTLNPDDADDYPRIYQVKISDKPLDFNGAIRASGAGVLGQTLVVTLAEPIIGRYLLVQQKGKDDVNWWSVSELTARCF